MNHVHPIDVIAVLKCFRASEIPCNELGGDRVCVGMKLARISAILILSLTPTLLNSQTKRLYTNWYSGSEMASYCLDGNSMSSFCSGYIIGIAELLGRESAKANDKRLCLPMGVTNIQLRQIFSNYLQKHPERWQYSTDFLAEQSLTEAFGCRSVK